MRLSLDAMVVDVPAELVDEARNFYDSRGAGRGPSTLEELRVARARRSVPAPADPLAIGGSSAGATLALATLLRLRDTGAVDGFAGAVLQFGTYDLSGQTPAGRRIADEFFIQAYVGHVADRTASDVSPIFGDLRGLPPALLVVGSADVLLEDNLALAGRLAAAGNDGELRIYAESPHGFTGHPTAMAMTAMRGIDSWLLDRFAQPSDRSLDGDHAALRRVTRTEHPETTNGPRR